MENPSSSLAQGHQNKSLATTSRPTTRFCLAHGGFDSDGDDECSVFALAHPVLRETMMPCVFE